MRDPSGVVQELGSPVLGYQGGKDYATKVNFNCMATSGDARSLAICGACLITICTASAISTLGATTVGHDAGDGYIAVGSEDGQIRMYSDKSLTRANTAIPGLGAPITAVDVTYDGKWVLATTRNYLMVVKTTYKVCKLPGVHCPVKFRSPHLCCYYHTEVISSSAAGLTGFAVWQDAKDKETNGFKSRMGARGAAPRLLRLKAEDVELVGSAPLQKGKFTWITESGREERWIVASCGNYTVLWNFRCDSLCVNYSHDCMCFAPLGVFR